MDKKFIKEDKISCHPKLLRMWGLKILLLHGGDRGPGCLYRKQPIYQLEYSRHSKCTAICDTLSNIEEGKRQSCPLARHEFK